MGQVSARVATHVAKGGWVIHSRYDQIGHVHVRIQLEIGIWLIHRCLFFQLKTNNLCTHTCLCFAFAKGLMSYVCANCMADNNLIDMTLSFMPCEIHQSSTSNNNHPLLAPLNPMVH